MEPGNPFQGTYPPTMGDLRTTNILHCLKVPRPLTRGQTGPMLSGTHGLGARAR